MPKQNVIRPATNSGDLAPVRRLWKDVMRVGRYAHPAGRYALSVDRARLDRWVAAFARMAANGVRVTIPLDHSTRARDNVGHVTAMRRVGDRLFALHEFAGDAAADLAARNQVSIGLHPDFIDGAGRRYGEAIVHVALTPVPVVPNQGPWRRSPPGADDEAHDPSAIPLAASRSPARGMIWLSGAAAKQPEESEGPMDITPEQLAEAQAILGGDPLTADTFVDRVLAHLRQLAAEESTEPATELHRAIAAKDAQIAALSRAAVPPPPLDDASRDALVEAARAKKDLAVARGGVTPAVADKLFARLVRSADGTVNVLALSRAAGTGGGDACLALSVFDALAENRPVRGGEVTGVQTLARVVPDAGAPDPHLQQRMIALASGSK